MTPKEKVQFLIEQGQNSFDLRYKISNMKPGEIINWNFPNGLVPMARAGANGSLNALGGAFTHFGLSEIGQRSLVRPPGTQRTDFDYDQHGRFSGFEGLFKKPDIPKLLEDEVRKHLPWGLPLHVVRATLAETRHGYNVGIWVTAGDLHEAELIGEVFVSYNPYKDWRATMLNDLADDITRRVAC